MFVCSQQPVPEKLQIRVNRISMAAYEALHYDKDQLKEACKCEGLVICKVAAVLPVKCMFNCVYCVWGTLVSSDWEPAGSVLKPVTVDGL